MTDTVAALVLAGGRARRMGVGDKPLLPVGGQPMIARVIAALHPLPVAISANGDPARFAAFGCPVLNDGPFEDQGPLAGLLAGMDWAAEGGAARLLTIPGDAPFVPSGLAHRLCPAPACAASGGRVHHLIALWPISARDALRSLLSRPGPRDVHHFAASIGMRRVDFPTGKWDPFTNVNTPEDLAAARALAEETGTESAIWP